jgi:hypothetical protein
MPGATVQSLVIPRDDGRSWHDYDDKNWGAQGGAWQLRKKDGARTARPGRSSRSRHRRAARGRHPVLPVPHVRVAANRRAATVTAGDRSSGTRSRCSPTTTRTSSASTPAGARSTLRSSSARPASASRGDIAADGTPNGRKISQQPRQVVERLLQNPPSLQVALREPTGGLEPPTPSLRVNPSRITRAYRCARQRTNRLHRPRNRSDARGRAHALVVQLKDPGRTRPLWSRERVGARPPGASTPPDTATATRCGCERDKCALGKPDGAGVEARATPPGWGPGWR